MATYNEIAILKSQGEKLNEIEVSIATEVEVINEEPNNTTNHNERVDWAAKAASNTRSEANRFHLNVLIFYIDRTVEEIQDLTDAEVQAAVSSLVDLFAVADSNL